MSENVYEFDPDRRRAPRRNPPAEATDPTPAIPSSLPLPVEVDHNDEASPDEVLVGEIVDQPDDRREYSSGEPVYRSAPRVRPILPAWLRSRAELRDAVRWAWSYAWRTTAFHTVRVPVYGAILAGRSPRGAFRAVGAASRWVFDADARPVRSAVIAKADAEMYIKLVDRRNDRVRLRLIVAGLSLIPALVGVGFLLLAPEPIRWAVLTVLVLLLGVLGAPADRPLISRAVVATKAQKLTSDIVVRALGALGIAQINQAVAKGGGITFPAPITREGRGWRADVDLPYGVTVTDIIDRRERLASGLRRPLGCVWPEPAHDEHAGRLVLWVGDEDLGRTAPPVWPLAKRGQVDLFGPLPLGVDPRGRQITVTLPENNVLIGAIPGAGKTATVRIPMLGAALDPTAEIWVFNLKGNNDLAAAEKFAHRYAMGQDDATIEKALGALRDLKGELSKRAAALAKLPSDLCPDGKVTRQIADRKSLGLHPLVAFIDECQNLFSHAEYGKEAGELAEHIIKLGRALGVILVLATQRPDAHSLPTGVSANVSVRFCLRVMGQVENDMVLGTSMYKNGVRATTLRASDKGIGYLVGATDDPVIVKTSYLDIPTSDAIGDRARALRIAAGRLAGYAAGQADETTTGPVVNVLDDVLAVWPTGQDKAWSETITARLAELRPELYGGWEPGALAAALKPYGITTGRQVWGTDPATGKGANRKGLHHDDLTTALAERNRKRSAD